MKRAQRLARKKIPVHVTGSYGQKVALIPDPFSYLKTHRLEQATMLVRCNASPPKSSVTAVSSVFPYSSIFPAVRIAGQRYLGLLLSKYKFIGFSSRTIICPIRLLYVLEYERNCITAIATGILFRYKQRNDHRDLHPE